MSVDSKKSSFPAPRIASSKRQPEPLDLGNIDMSKDGVQGNAVVSKRRAATFVTRVPDEKEGK